MPFKNKQKAKEYQREYMKKRRKENPIKTRELNRISYENLKEKNPNYHKDYYKKNRDRIIDTSIKTYQRNRLRHNIEQMTRKYYKKEKQCGICRDTKNLEFHHWIYKMPLEKKHFSTLCSFCHGVQHGGKRQ